MNHNKQVQEIVNHFKISEKNVEEFKIGVEFEHFVINKDTMETISYYGENGVGETLKDLEKNGWEGIYEDEYILGLNKGIMTITLEPGSQFEFSMVAQKNIGDIEKVYLEFLGELIPILEKKNQRLISTGYHPNMKIDDIKLLPKKRYDLMFDYFKTRGSHAHNMMKGTAALQVSLDYKSEEDYAKKFRVTNKLSPVLHAIFDNSYYFEGGKWGKHNLRTFIWNNCDSGRAGMVTGALDEDFNYEKYAEFVLNAIPIFTMKGEKVVPTGKDKMKDIFDPDDYELDELEHLLTMIFPDVRTKRYIEIRMIDSLPYPLNLAAVALLTGIVYSDDNLNKIDGYLKDISVEDVEESKLDIIENGLKGKLGERTVLEIGKYLVELAKEGLPKDEIKYILPLEEMINNNENPYELTRKSESADWCIFKNPMEVE